MFGRKKKDKHKGSFKEKVEKEVKKIEDNAKKDIQIVKDDIKKLEKSESSDFWLTYGWAILAIAICITGFIWWQYISVYSEYCSFIEGSNLICENFDATNEALSMEIRNLNEEDITINEIKLQSCAISPEQGIKTNDKKKFNVPCSISSGNLKERVVVAYTIEDFQKHVTAKISKIVP